MKITADVIRDLLGAYASGDASADTRALVEAWLADHPEMAAEAREAASWRLPEAGAGGPAEESGRAALRRTQRLLRSRSMAMGIAIFLSALPFSFAGGEDGFRWLFWPEHSATASISLALAAIAWGIFLGLDRRLKPRGF